MDVSGQETDWRSTAFRQKLVSQIEDAMRKAGVAHNKSSKDMESHVFLKAKTRDEYLSLVARLIIHFRDIPVVQQQQQQLQQQQQQQQHLIKLHHQNQQQVPGLLFLLLASLLQCEPWPPMQQPQPPPTQALPQQLQQMHHPQHHQPPPQPQQPPVAQNQPSQLPPQSQTQPLVSQAQALPGQMLYTQPPLKFVSTCGPQWSTCSPWLCQQYAPAEPLHFQVSQSSLPMLSSPSPGQQVQTPQSMPPPPQPSPQPGQPGSQPNSNVRPALPGPWLTCFSHLSAAPALPHPPVASCPALHQLNGLTHLCPAVNPSSVMSPAGSSQAEEQQYLDKLKQLSKYIEPLRRMINKIDKNEDRKKDLSKMKTLHTAHGGSTGAWIPTPHRPRWPRPNSGSSLCQPLLTPVLGPAHSFAAMTAIHGPTHPAPVVCTRKRRLEDDERQSIPSVLQGEVARLDPKFLVNLDPSHCSNNGTVHLICKLDDKDLPSVPPLELSVPADYPAQSPLWIDRQWQYDANPFLQSVHRCMTSRLLQLPDKHSVTALLNTWAQSVHQACLSAA
uniref:Mediator of RNA polymerase II transcription subunit 15 n=1 Tax=Rhinopithecus bieti TaxID=61621 RepID=A0A2K6JZ92_RHIBE